MTTRKHVTFEPKGLGPLALDAQAFGATFELLPFCVPLEAPPEPPPVAVVPVRGPLMNHYDDDFASYEALLSWVRAEIMWGRKTILLDLDTPGGLVAGVFETARAMRDECRAAGVQLVAYVGGQCCSAGYALACAASIIVAPAASTTGSIGVLEELKDATREASAKGLRYTFVTSGARKADGNPYAGISPETVAARQQHVDDLAGVFFDWVAANRPLTAEGVRALEAGTFAGTRALSLKLIDRVQDFDDLRKGLAQQYEPVDDLEEKSPGVAAIAQTPEKTAMATKATLKSVLEAFCADEDGDENDKKAAHGLLAEMGDDAEPDKKEKEPDAKAEGDGPDKKDPPDDKASDEDKECAKAIAANPLLAMSLENARLKAGLGATAASEIETLLASRPDLDKAVVAMLKQQKLPVVRHYIRHLPKAVGSPLAASLAALGSGAKPTPADTRGGGAPRNAATKQSSTPVASAHSTIVDHGHEVSFSVAKPGARKRPPLPQRA